MDTLQDTVKKMMATKKYTDKINALLKLVADNKMNMSDLEATLAEFKIKREIGRAHV